MSTKRTRISRPQRTPIAPRAIALFREMQALETKCTCEPIDWDGKYWEHEQCPACDRWWDLHAELHDEIGAKLHEWPGIETPGARTPYPEGSNAAADWKPDLEAQERYRVLEQAAAEEEAKQ
jgi:hypothetical protein